jgi:hypothetical protein
MTPTPIAIGTDGVTPAASEVVITVSVVVTAVFTAILAVATVALVRVTHTFAREGARQAAAAADLVAEMRHDRDFALEPYLVYLSGNDLKNVGRGPALYCTVAWWVQRDGTVWVTAPFHLGAGEQAPIMARGSPGAHPGEELLGESIQDALHEGRTEVRVLVCEDRRGRRYRFSQDAIDAEVWEPGEPQRPWTVWH